MSPLELQELAIAGELTAEALRKVWPRLSDERLTRVTLAALGWRYCRRRDAWIRVEGELEQRIQGSLTLKGSLALACGYMWDSFVLPKAQS